MVYGLDGFRRRRGVGVVEVAVKSSSIVAAWESLIGKGHESEILVPIELLKEGFVDRKDPLSHAAINVRSYLVSAVQVRLHFCSLEMACGMHWTSVLEEAED